MADAIVPFEQWGPQANGFVTPTFRDILYKVEADQGALIDPDFDNEPDAPDGVNNGIFCRQLAAAWEVLSQIHDAHNRDNASGELLTDLGKLTGTPRKGADYTTVVTACTLAAGTTLVEGEAFAYPVDRPSELFTPAANYTADTSGDHSVVFVAVDTGPKLVAAGELTVISAPVTGWTAITNAADGVPGRDIETDPEFRISQDNDLARAGSSTTAAIASDVMAAGLTGITAATCKANIWPDRYDADGRPPMTVEVILEVDGTDDDQEISDLIWNLVPAGHSTFGSKHGIHVDENGELQDVYWSEVLALPVYLAYTLVTGPGYVGDAAVSDYVAEQATLRFHAGQDITAVWLKACPLGLSGVLDCTAFTLGLAAAPTGTVNIPISVRQRGTFAAGRIAVTS